MTDIHPPDHPGDETYTAVSSPDADAADHPVELPIGIVLRQLRGERSLRAVQKGSGVSNTYLCNLEQGIQRPGFRILERLADYYGVSISDLFRRAEMLREHGEAYRRAHDADVERSYRFLMDDPYLEQYDKAHRGTAPGGQEVHDPPVRALHRPAAAVRRGLGRASHTHRRRQ